MIENNQNSYIEASVFEMAIKEIIETDKECSEILSKAEKKTSDPNSVLTDRINDYRKKKEKEIGIKYEEFCNNFKKNAEITETMSGKYEKGKQKFQEYFAENKDIISEEIYKRIIEN